MSTFLQEVEGEEPWEVADCGGAGGSQRAVEEDEGAAGGNLDRVLVNLLSSGHRL